MNRHCRVGRLVRCLGLHDYKGGNGGMGPTDVPGDSA